MHGTSTDTPNRNFFGKKLNFFKKTETDTKIKAETESIKIKKTNLEVPLNIASENYSLAKKNLAEAKENLKKLRNLQDRNIPKKDRLPRTNKLVELYEEDLELATKGLRELLKREGAKSLSDFDAKIEAEKPKERQK